MPRETAADRAYQYYPAFLDLRRKHVVIVGGGAIATGKVSGVLPCGPDPLVVIAPEVTPVVRDAADRGQLTWRARPYEPGDLAGADLCFAATDDRALNARVAGEARERRVPVLAVDDIPNCDFIAPSVVRRGDLIVATSTGGRSPAMARWVRERFDRELPEAWGQLLDAAATARERLGARRRQVSPETWLAALDAAQALAATVNREELTAFLLRQLAPMPVPVTGEGEGRPHHAGDPSPAITPRPANAPS